MAKITKETVYILGESFDIDIKCSSKGIFEAALPMKYRGALQVSAFEEKTLPDLLKKLSSAVREINELNTVTEFVICYKMSTMASFTQPDTYISLSWRALKKETTGKQVRHYLISKQKPYGENIEEVLTVFYVGHYFSGHGEVVNPDRDSCIPFSPDSYDFFENAIKALDSIKQKMKAFLEPESLVLSIESGNLKMIG